MKSRWPWIGLGIVLGLTVLPGWGADPDPEAVRRLMEKYRREAEAEKHPPAHKPVAKPATKPAPKKPTVNYDREAWRSAEKCGTTACFEAYLADYPKGRYARMARARLKAASAPRTPVTPAVVAPATSPRRSLIEPETVRIPSGCFQMGSSESERGRDEDERQHEVCVDAFEIGKDEVTMGEFKRFVEATNHRTDAERNEGCFVLIDGESAAWREGYSWRKPGYTQHDNYPVVCVSWNDAIAYTVWLNRETRQSYRLPTEAEWEYAARAGTTTVRYWGNDPNQACQYANVADRTLSPGGRSWDEKHECTDGYWSPAPVGRFRANNWQLNDMLGNVWEWTCSLYDKNYGGVEKNCNFFDKNSARTVRGGSYSDVAAAVRSANRDKFTPLARANLTGFRLARSL